MSWIARRIADRGGEVSFRDYMAMALYDPDHGYYATGPPPFGRAGDFLTAPTASHWYAEVLARVVRRILESTGAITLVDVGSGDGSLIAGIASRLPEARRKGCARLISIEAMPRLRELQRKRLDELGFSCQLVAGIDELQSLGSATFLHVCELYDALPCHLVEGAATAVVELWIATTHGGLEIVRRPASDELVASLDGHGIALEDGQRAEIRPALRELHERLLGCAGDDGLAVVVDYGYPARRLYDPRARRGGSLACHHRHRVSRDPLVAPGEQDITAHVNWDDLRSAAAAREWQEIGTFPLAEFLVRAGIEKAMNDGRIGGGQDLSARVVAERQEVKRLLDPEGMGSDLKVLVQGRGCLLDLAARILQAPR
jgi:SAM-dependent MidA family methyltransferase